MEKVEEGFKLELEETEEAKIKEVDFILNTAQSGYASHITEMINGYLEVACITTDEPVQIRIGIYEKDVVMFEDVNFSGNKYLPLRIAAIDLKGEMFNYSHERWCLNDRLIVEVKGQNNALVKVRLRYC